MRFIFIIIKLKWKKLKIAENLKTETNVFKQLCI